MNEQSAAGLNGRAWSERRVGMQWRARGLERLEARRALAGDAWHALGSGDEGILEEFTGFFDWGGMPVMETIGIVEVTPGTGTALGESPEEITVRVDRALDPGSVLAEDLRLERWEPDGGVTEVAWDGAGGMAPGVDGDGTVAHYLLGRVLEAGRYRVVLTSRAFWFAMDGAMLPFTESEPVLTEFEVKAAKEDADRVTELGVVGSTVVTVEGSLDLDRRPLGVAYYRFTLPAGHFWRLGAELTAERRGSAFRGAISLFGDEGKLMARSVVGRPDHPNDPYLFAGLRPGEYVIGISGAGAALRGVGEAASAAPGFTMGGPGGAFTLQLVADAVDEAPRVLSFELDRGDASSRRATGFTVQFSRALREHVNEEGILDGIAGGLELVDGEGRVWPIVPRGFEEAQARVSYVFERSLPAGVYAVRLSRGGSGLADLAGLAPVSSNTALPTGVLGRFRVAPGLVRRDVNDLGAVPPGEMLEGIRLEAGLAPGATRVWRYVNLMPEYVDLDFLGGGAGLQATIRRMGVSEGEGEPVARLEGGTRVLVRLAAGEYEIEVTNGGDSRASGLLGLRYPSLDWEVILGSGLGQGPALGLRLITPSVGVGLTGSAHAVGESGGSTAPGGVGIGPVYSPGGAGLGSVEAGVGGLVPGSGTGGEASGGGHGGVVIPGSASGMSVTVQAFAQAEQAAVGRTISAPQWLAGQALGQTGAGGPFVVITTGPQETTGAPGLALEDVAATPEGEPGRPEELKPDTELGRAGDDESAGEQHAARGGAGVREVERARAGGDTDPSPASLATAVDEILGRFLFPMRGRSAHADAAAEAALLQAPEELVQAETAVGGASAQRERQAEFAGFGSPLDAGLAMLGILQARRFWARWRERRGGGKGGSRTGSQEATRRGWGGSGSAGG